jgi:ribosomal-protein-alanine N-acetyltransferase
MIRLRTERLELRELPPAAAPRVAAFIRENWAFHREWEPSRPAEYFTSAAHRRILRWEARSDTVTRFWLLKHRDPAHPGGWRRATIIGSASLSSIVRGAFQSCFLGYKIGERYAQRGYMTEALHAVVRCGFTTLALHRIEANVIPRNAASLALVRRVGFRHEGTAIRYLKIAGEWEDHVHMVLLKEEWERSQSSPTP